MKRILFLLTALALPVGLFGQGQVVFQNTSTTRFTTNGSGGSGYISGANQYRIGLYTAPDGTVNESLFTLVAVATNSAIVPGRFSYQENPYTLAGNNGTPIAFQIKAWSLSAGNSFEAAMANASFGQTVYAGKSPIGRVTPAIGGLPPPRLFGEGESPGQLTSGVTLYGQLSGPTPEPSTYALAALGALMFFCWRKRRVGKL
jgi:hypothetical protein